MDVGGRPADFGRLARGYRWLEWLAFGRGLERARVAHLAALADCRRILVIGEGDGRALARIVARCPEAAVTVIEASAAMIALARARLSPASRARVRFVQADVRTTSPADASYDAIVTFFVLDCFVDEDVRRIVRLYARALAPDGLWLWADFAQPVDGWRRTHARVWLALLYWFFRWRTGLEARRLPDAVGALRDAGLVEVQRTDWRGGLLTSRVFERALGGKVIWSG